MHGLCLALCLQDCQRFGWALAGTTTLSTASSQQQHPGELWMACSSNMQQQQQQHKLAWLAAAVCSKLAWHAAACSTSNDRV
jgi:hypothetical protein